MYLELGKNWPLYAALIVGAILRPIVIVLLVASILVMASNALIQIAKLEWGIESSLAELPKPDFVRLSFFVLLLLVQTLYWYNHNGFETRGRFEDKDRHSEVEPN